jgi:NADH pyrophosphatase NudC (nudix superfamily)
MIGCHVQLTSELSPKADQKELEDAKWFDKEQVKEMLHKGLNAKWQDTMLRMPPPSAIAHNLAKAWVESS